MNAALPACDRTAASSGKGSSAPNANMVLATTILASSLAFIDGSVVNVGLPAIGKSLGASGGGLSWVLNGYLLPLSALLLIGGAAGDLYGRRKLLVGGIALFALASLLCALAPTLELLVAGRVAQGVGAAMLMPNSLAILGASFSGEARGKAIGTWAAAGAAGAAIGPLAGGWLIDQIGWRAIFLVNLPVAAAALVMALRYVRDQVDDQRPPLDIVGAALVTAALGLLTWVLTTASGPAGIDALTWGMLAVGVACAIGFVLVERARGAKAMMPLDLFTSPSFTGLTVLTLLLYGALGGLLVLIPYVLIRVQGYSATAAGAALLPLPIILSIASPSMGRLAGRIGSRLPLSVGPAVVAIGCLLAARIGQGGYWTTVFPAITVIAAGMAGAVAPLTTAVLASVEPRHTGIASGFNSAVARTGGLIATALLAAVLAATGDALIADYWLACAIGAGVALAAGAAAFAWVRKG